MEAWKSFGGETVPLSIRSKKVADELMGWSRRKFKNAEKQISVLKREMQAITNHSTSHYDTQDELAKNGDREVMETGRNILGHEIQDQLA